MEIARLAHDDEGAVMAEYSLLIMLVAVATVVSIASIRDQLVRIFFDVAGALTTRR
jgi:Flp pilus assembly pilin Flp